MGGYAPGDGGARRPPIWVTPSRCELRDSNGHAPLHGDAPSGAPPCGDAAGHSGTTPPGRATTHGVRAQERWVAGPDLRKGGRTPTRPIAHGGGVVGEPLDALACASRIRTCRLQRRNAPAYYRQQPLPLSEAKACASPRPVNSGMRFRQKTQLQGHRREAGPPPMMAAEHTLPFAHFMCGGKNDGPCGGVNTGLDDRARRTNKMLFYAGSVWDVAGPPECESAARLPFTCPPGDGRPAAPAEGGVLLSYGRRYEPMGLPLLGPPSPLARREDDTSGCFRRQGSGMPAARAASGRHSTTRPQAPSCAASAGLPLLEGEVLQEAVVAGREDAVFTGDRQLALCRDEAAEAAHDDLLRPHGRARARSGHQMRRQLGGAALAKNCADISGETVILGEVQLAPVVPVRAFIGGVRGLVLRRDALPIAARGGGLADMTTALLPRLLHSQHGLLRQGPVQRVLGAQWEVMGPPSQIESVAEGAWNSGVAEREAPGAAVHAVPHGPAAAADVALPRPPSPEAGGVGDDGRLPEARAVGAVVHDGAGQCGAAAVADLFLVAFAAEVVSEEALKHAPQKAASGVLDRERRHAPIRPHEPYELGDVDDAGVRVVGGLRGKPIGVRAQTASSGQPTAAATVCQAGGRQVEVEWDPDHGAAVGGDEGKLLEEVAPQVKVEEVGDDVGRECLLDVDRDGPSAVQALRRHRHALGTAEEVCHDEVVGGKVGTARAVPPAQAVRQLPVRQARWVVPEDGHGGGISVTHPPAAPGASGVLGARPTSRCAAGGGGSFARAGRRGARGSWVVHAEAVLVRPSTARAAGRLSPLLADAAANSLLAAYPAAGSILAGGVVCRAGRADGGAVRAVGLAAGAHTRRADSGRALVHSVVRARAGSRGGVPSGAAQAASPVVGRADAAQAQVWRSSQPEHALPYGFESHHGALGVVADGDLRRVIQGRDVQHDASALARLTADELRHSDGVAYCQQRPLAISWSLDGNSPETTALAYRRCPARRHAGGGHGHQHGGGGDAVPTDDITEVAAAGGPDHHGTTIDGLHEPVVREVTPGDADAVPNLELHPAAVDSGARSIFPTISTAARGTATVPARRDHGYDGLGHHAGVAHPASSDVYADGTTAGGGDDPGLLVTAGQLHGVPAPYGRPQRILHGLLGHGCSLGGLRECNSVERNSTPTNSTAGTGTDFLGTRVGTRHELDGSYSPLQQADAAFRSLIRCRTGRRQWRSWRRWRARRAAEAGGRVRAGLSARSPAWTPPSQWSGGLRDRLAQATTARRLAVRPSGGGAAWQRWLAAGKGEAQSLDDPPIRPGLETDSDRAVTAGLDGAQTTTTTDGEDTPTLWVTPLRLRAVAPGLGTTAPLTISDYRGLARTDGLVNAAVINAYMALLPTQGLAVASAFTSAIFRSPELSSYGRSMRTLADECLDATLLYIPWRIPGGLGHWMSVLVDLHTWRVRIFNPLRPNASGSRRSRQTGIIRGLLGALQKLMRRRGRISFTSARTTDQAGTVDCGVHLILAFRTLTTALRSLPADGSLHRHLAAPLDPHGTGGLPGRQVFLTHSSPALLRLEPMVLRRHLALEITLGAVDVTVAPAGAEALEVSASAGTTALVQAAPPSRAARTHRPMPAAPEEQPPPHMDVQPGHAVRHLLKGRLKQHKPQGTVTKRHRRRGAGAVRKTLPGGGAAPVPPIVPSMLTSAPGDRPASGTHFYGQNVLRVHIREANDQSLIRALTWNVRGSLTEDGLDYLLKHITPGGADWRSLPPGETQCGGMDFVSLQELGPRYAGRQTRRIWQSAPEEDGTSHRTSWCWWHTEYVALIWDEWWDDRRLGQPEISPDRRTISVSFSSPQGKILVVAHYGVPAPKVMTDAGPQSAGACVGHLLAAVRRHSGAALKLVLGDLNTQRRSSRIDVGGAASPDAAEQLLVQTQTEAGLVDPVEAVRGSCAVSARVLLSSSGELGGVFSLALGGSTTRPIPVQATAQEVEAALRGLPGMGRVCCTLLEARDAVASWLLESSNGARLEGLTVCTDGLRGEGLRGRCTMAKAPWSRRISQGGNRTRPDYTLVGGDWAKFKIRRAGIAQDLADAQAYSDHRMVAVEVKATRRLPRVRSERVRPPGYFTTRDAADEDWLEWDDLVEKIQLDAPSQGSWETGGRAYYDCLIARLSEAGSKAFDSPGSVRKIIRPWWDKVAGRMRSQVASALLTRSRCDALARARPHQVDRSWRRLLAVRSERHLPEPIAALMEDGRGTDVPALASMITTTILSLRKDLKYRNRRRRMKSMYTSRQREKGLAMSERAKRALRRTMGGRDPYVAKIPDGDGGTFLSTDKEVVKRESGKMARRWFNSDRNWSRYVVRWRTGVEEAAGDAVLAALRARPGAEPVPVEEAAVRSRQALAGGGRSDLVLLPAMDVAWMADHSDVRSITLHSSPYAVWYKPRAEHFGVGGPIEKARELDSGCAMPQIAATADSAMGRIETYWMTHEQRKVVAAESKYVLAVLPMPPMVFYDNAPAARSGLPLIVQKAFALAAHDGDGDGVGPCGHWVCPKKQRHFDKLMRPKVFRVLFDQALSRVNPKAAPGADFLTAPMATRLPEGHKQGLSEYMRLAIVNMDLSTRLTMTILKWLPKSADGDPWVDNTSRDFPRLRPVGLNSVFSKVFEYILFEVQLRTNSDDMRQIDAGMYAWFRGRRATSAALKHELICEDSRRSGRPLHLVSLDARHQFDMCHTTTSVMVERALGYPPAISAAKASVKAGGIRVRTEFGRSFHFFPECGLGQGRVEATGDSNRLDTCLLWAVSKGNPYLAFAGTPWSTAVSWIYYADDRNLYGLPPGIDGGAGLQEQVDETTAFHHFSGGSLTASKCCQRSVFLPGAAPIRPVRDVASGGLRPIPYISSSTPVRYLGFYSDLEGRSTAGSSALLRRCSEDVGNLSRPTVLWAPAKYAVNHMLAGVVGYSSLLTRGGSAAALSVDKLVAKMALHKLGERSSNSSDFLWVRGGIGMGLKSALDTWSLRMVTELMHIVDESATEAYLGRPGDQREDRRLLEGAAHAYSRERLTTLPFGRPRRRADGKLVKGDGSVCERLHAALSHIGFTLVPKDTPARRPRGEGGRPGVSADGGRYADWRLADVLPLPLLEDTHRWRLRYSLEWIGQMMSQDGLCLDTEDRWLVRLAGPGRRCQTSGAIHLAVRCWLQATTAPAAVAAASASEAATAAAVAAVAAAPGAVYDHMRMLRGVAPPNDYVVSPVPQTPMATLNTLAPGQMAIIPVVILDGSVRSGSRMDGGFILVQGICEGGFAGDCPDCKEGDCSLDHSPTLAFEAEGGMRVQVRRYHHLGSPRIFSREHHDLYDIDTPARFLLVRPRVSSRAGLTVLLPVVGTEDTDRWASRRDRLIEPGEPIHISVWRAELERQRGHWHDKLAETWLCSWCGEGRRGHGLSGKGDMHEVCAAYPSRWRRLIEGVDTRWLYRLNGEVLAPDADCPLVLSRPLEQTDVASTDASATRGASGGALVRCDVGAHVPQETLGFRIHGRLGERDVSYAGEMMSAIVLGMNIGTDATTMWVGDNESVQQVVSAYLTQARDNPLWLPPRAWKSSPALRLWLLHVMRGLMGRGSNIRVIHQRSHLSISTPIKRAMDNRMVLELADRAAERARESSSLEVNLSGIHPGVGSYLLRDAENFRVDGRYQKAIATALQDNRKKRWAEGRPSPPDRSGSREPSSEPRDALQTRFLRQDPLHKSFGHPGSHAAHSFAGKLLRQTIPTSCCRADYDDLISEACQVCKWAPVLPGTTGYVEALQGQGKGQSWGSVELMEETPAVPCLVTVRGSSGVFSVESDRLRQGRWARHNTAHVLGTSLRTLRPMQMEVERAMRRHSTRVAALMVAPLGARSKVQIGFPYEFIAFTMLAWRQVGPVASSVVEAAADATLLHVSDLLRSDLRGNFLGTEFSRWEAGRLSSALQAGRNGAAELHEEEPATPPLAHDARSGLRPRLLRWFLRHADSLLGWVSRRSGGQGLPLPATPSPRASRCDDAWWTRYHKVTTSARLAGMQHRWMNVASMYQCLQDDLVGSLHGRLRTVPRSGDLPPDDWALVLGPERKEYTKPRKGPPPPGGRASEPKVSRVEDLWQCGTRTLHDRQMQVLLDLAGGSALGPTLLRLPASPRPSGRWTLREETVRVLAAASGIQLLLGVSLWNPYSLKIRKCGPRTSELLGIGLTCQDGPALWTAYMGLAEMAAARQRDAPTLGLTAAFPLPPEADLVAMIPSGRLHPEWDDSCFGIKVRNVRARPIWRTLRLVVVRGRRSVGDPAQEVWKRRLVVALQRHLSRLTRKLVNPPAKLLSAATNADPIAATRASLLAAVAAAQAASAAAGFLLLLYLPDPELLSAAPLEEQLASGPPETVASGFVTSCTHWESALLTKTLKRSLLGRGAGSRDVPALMGKWHRRISRAQHTAWALHRRQNDSLVRLGIGESPAGRSGRRATEKTHRSEAAPCAPPQRARKPFGDVGTRQARKAAAARQASYMRAMVPRGSVATYVDDGEDVVFRAHVRAGSSLPGAAEASGVAPREVHVERVSLSGAGLTQADVAQLCSGMPALRSLTLSACTLTHTLHASLMAACPGLRELRLCSVSGLRAADLSAEAPDRWPGTLSATSCRMANGRLLNVVWARHDCDLRFKRARTVRFSRAWTGGEGLQKSATKYTTRNGVRFHFTTAPDNYDGGGTFTSPMWWDRLETDDLRRAARRGTHRDLPDDAPGYPLDMRSWAPTPADWERLSAHLEVPQRLLALEHLLDLEEILPSVEMAARKRCVLPLHPSPNWRANEAARVYTARVHALLASTCTWRGLSNLVRRYNESILRHMDGDKAGSRPGRRSKIGALPSLRLPEPHYVLGGAPDGAGPGGDRSDWIRRLKRWRQHHLTAHVAPLRPGVELSADYSTMHVSVAELAEGGLPTPLSWARLNGRSYTSSSSVGATNVSSERLLPLRRFLLRAHAGGFPTTCDDVVAARYAGKPPSDAARAAASRRKARPLAADLADRRRLRAAKRAAMTERRDGAARRGPGPRGALFCHRPADALQGAANDETGPAAARTPAVGRRAHTDPRQSTATHTQAQTQPTTPTTADEHDPSSTDVHLAAPAQTPGPGAANTTNRESSATERRGAARRRPDLTVTPAQAGNDDAGSTSEVAP